MSETTSSVSGTNVSGASPIPTSMPNISQFITVKLTTSNYLLWKAQIQPLLNGYRLASYIDGSKPAPPETLTTGEPNPAYMDWFCNDQIVRSWINSSVSETIMTQIVHCHTTKDAWDTLEVINSKGARTKVQ